MVASNEIKRCHVYTLDEQKLNIPLQSRLLTTELLDIVASHFNLKEKEYFGLFYYDNRECRCWLKSDKKVVDHDFPKTSSPVTLHFGVKKYIDTITILRDNQTIELFYFQCRINIFKGALECESRIVFQLAAHVLQATHGDYVSDAIALADLKNLQVVPVRTLQEHPTLSFCEEEIIREYKNLDGLTKGDAVIGYLRIIESLPMYGVHYYDVKDKEQIPWKLGLSHKGAAQYDFHDKNMPRKRFSWSQMENLFYRDKKFTLEYRDSGPRTSSNHSLNRLNTIRKSISHRIKSCVWYASSSTQCRDIWLMAVEQHQFYLDKKQSSRSINGQRCLKEMARNLCRSSTSLVSMKSTGSGIQDNTSETASYYFSLDGDSQNSQVIAAEMDMVSALQARKSFLEKQLIEKRELLNILCLREAELTGIVPSELPESPTHPGRPMRRKVGTSFEFDESLLENPDFERPGTELENMERDFEIQKQIVNAAHRLASDPSAKKKVKKARQLSYQKSLVKLKTMEQQLEYMRRDEEEQGHDFQDHNWHNNKKDEGGSGSLGDSLGPIDGESSSSKDSSNYTPSPLDSTNNMFKKRARDSMYLATPVINTSNMSSTNSPFSQRRHYEPSPRQNGGWSASVTASPVNGHNSTNEHDSFNEFSEDYDTSFSRERLRTQSVGNRLHKKPPLPTVVKVRAKEFHSSADMLSQDTNDSPHQYVCGDFESTGMYSASAGQKKYGDYGSNPSIPHSYSSPGIAGRVHRHSPATAKRLEQLSLSPSSGAPRPPPSYAQHSMESGSEQSEDMWHEDAGEETLV
ncbi:FERM domain-containing protein 4A-like isoform X2 [Clytia hemisphaerica]|uniref:FERM domain-containing protein n=1 Tax=Clytia hemisphaerica TaxID=252671 RepID=A0A7M5XJV5_9CNID